MAIEIIEELLMIERCLCYIFKPIKNDNTKPFTIFINIYYLNSESSLKVNKIHYSSGRKRVRQTLVSRKTKSRAEAVFPPEEVPSVFAGYPNTFTLSLVLLRSKKPYGKIV